ncbi:phage replisome organizer N-terminal domain protein [Megasphaera lornae]|uniref:Phage replisome organizer N-terminal domain protein n=1 Tax=Megasphaera lornae TaxID=1000568 RepID=D3LTK3_9FIRM|nr:phage replisome organizer N-terminal domain-containing protein [Megasphaera genomosp. type_1]EFD94542.1 phage replisome organizer N-terminal domain protein [Megasphaera genomosp. type_1 str. 28L]
MQHLQWVKVPVGYMDDPRMVYLTAQKNGTFLFTFWFYLRDLAAKINDGGRIGVTPRLPIAISTFAARFHKKPAVIEQALHVLLQLELLQRTADGLLYVTMWEDMQGGGSRREATRARVARWRQRQREARNAACPEEDEGTAAVEMTATAVAHADSDVMSATTETTATDVVPADSDVMSAATETTATDVAPADSDVMPAATDTTATAVAPADSDVMPATEATATAVAPADSDVMPAATDTTSSAEFDPVPDVMPATEATATDLFGSAPAEGTPATAAPDAAAAAATGDDVTEERIIIDEDGYEVILLPPKPKRTLPQVPTGADGRPVYGDLVRSLRTESPARDTLTVYTQAFGSPNDADRRELARLGDRYGDATLQTAIGRAQRYGIGNLRYIAKIAANMRGLSYGPTGTQSKCL